MTSPGELPLGAHPGFPESDYHSDCGLGSGSIKDLVRGPRAYDVSLRLPRESTAALDAGSAFHMRLLQPDRYAREVVELDVEVSFATKAGKELRAAIAAERDTPESELIFLKPDVVRRQGLMLEGLAAVTAAMGVDPFAERGPTECAHFWNDPAGVRGKALVDKQVDAFHWLVDVKTVRCDLDARSMFLYANEYGWAVQAAWYLRGVRATLGWVDAQFAFVVFQNEPPFSCRFVAVPPETIAEADKRIVRAFEAHREWEAARAARALPRDPNSGVLELRYPEWAVEA